MVETEIDRITVISENMKEFISGWHIKIYQFRTIFRFWLGINIFIGSVFTNKIIASVFLFKKKTVNEIVVWTKTRDIKWIKTANDSQSILFFNLLTHYLIEKYLKWAIRIKERRNWIWFLAGLPVLEYKGLKISKVLSTSSQII